MPRIDAPTVAEHHARKRADIVDAAVSILASEGAAAVTPAAVAAEAGLARSSIYQYYDSTGALVGAAVIETFHRAIADLRASVAQAAAPPERVRAYVGASLATAVQGHLPTMSYAALDLPEDCVTGIAQLHADLVAPLVDALTDAGVGDPEGTAGLISGAVLSAATRVQHGEPAEQVAASLGDFVLRGAGLA